MQIAQVGFGSQAEKLGIEQGFNVESIELPADRPDKEWMFIPALALLGVVVLTQRGGMRVEPKVALAAGWLNADRRCRRRVTAKAAAAAGRRSCCASSVRCCC